MLERAGQSDVNIKIHLTIMKQLCFLNLCLNVFCEQLIPFLDCVHGLKGEGLFETCVSAKISLTLIKKFISVPCPLFAYPFLSGNRF